MKTICLLLALTIASATAHLRSHRKLSLAADPTAKVDQQYIIVFDDTVYDVETKVTSLLSNAKGTSTTVIITYSGNLKGAAVSGVTEDTLWNILEDSQVAFVEEDQILNALEIKVQENPTWNLDRLDQSALPLNKAYEYSFTGSKVQSYIIDSGIRSSHKEFGGRIRCGFSTIGDDCDDSHGHGTHIAGIVGGTTFGVAKETELVAVKVLDENGAGRTSDVIAGIAYIVDQKRKYPKTPMLANLSLGGRASSAMDTAINNAVDDGIVFVVAAGNSGMNACWSSPASASKAIAVASTDPEDARPNSSNFGPCVDIFAPGESIVSSWIEDDLAVKELSGTSFAAAHVTAVAALYLQTNPSLTAEEILDVISSDAVHDVVQNPGRGSPNLLLNTENLSKRAEEYAKEREVNTSNPSATPSGAVSQVPSTPPSSVPSTVASAQPSVTPSRIPGPTPTSSPTAVPSRLPSITPTSRPSPFPSLSPSLEPSKSPTTKPTQKPSYLPEAEKGKELPIPPPPKEENNDSCKGIMRRCRADHDCCCGNCSFMRLCWIW